MEGTYNRQKYLKAKEITIKSWTKEIMQRKGIDTTKDI